MCLRTVAGTSTRTDEELIVYKVVELKDGHFLTPVKGVRLAIGVEYDAGAVQPLSSGDGGEYESGFHAFMSREDAEKGRRQLQTFKNRWWTPHQDRRFLVLEVRVRGIHTIGMDWNGLTVVANQMTPLRVLGPVGDGDDLASPPAVAKHEPKAPLIDGMRAPLMSVHATSV